ncbi:MAG: hypothetical protein V4501_11240 [Pseudomonadota bacterium]
MPINFTNFAYLPNHDNQHLDVARSIGEGLDVGRKPYDIYASQRKAALANIIGSVTAQYAEPTAQAKLGTLGAQRQQYLARALQANTAAAMDPLRTQAYVNQAGSAANLNNLKSQWVAPQAASAIQLRLAQKLKLDQPGTTNPRNLSPLGKLIIEKQNVANLKSPDGGQNIDPQTANELLNAYDRQMIKGGVPAKTLNRLGFANQMDITLNSMDGKALTAYAGPQGAAQFIADKAAALAGNPSPTYQAYMKNATLAQEFAKQYRQFAGDSVQPANFARIENLINPATWSNDPNTAAQQFNTVASSARTEGENLREQALDVNKWIQGPPTTDVYGSQSNPNNRGQVPLSIQAPQNGASQAPLRKDFSSKQDFQSYLKSLSPDQQKQLIKNLGGA